MGRYQFFRTMRYEIFVRENTYICLTDNRVSSKTARNIHSISCLNWSHMQYRNISNQPIILANMYRYI